MATKQRYIIYHEWRIERADGSKPEITRDYLGTTYAFSEKQALQFYLRRTGKRMRNEIYERADNVYSNKYIAIHE